jgi:hypothetical protein
MTTPCPACAEAKKELVERIVKRLERRRLFSVAGKNREAAGAYEYAKIIIREEAAAKEQP